MSSGMIQHLSIAITSNDLMESIESSCTWSLFVFSLEESTISNNYVLRIPTKYRLLKVLDFEDGELSFVPGNCGNLAHLSRVTPFISEKDFHLRRRGHHRGDTMLWVICIQSELTTALYAATAGTRVKERPIWLWANQTRRTSMRISTADNSPCMGERSCKGSSVPTFSSAGCRVLASRLNLILTGVKFVTLHDEGTVELWDISGSFVFSENDVGKIRAATSVSKLQELNNAVVVQSLTTQLTKEHLSNFQWLQNLETLDIRNTMVTKMPKEICKHRKLRHLLGDEMTLFQLKNSLRGMTSLQTLHQVSLVILDEYGEKINKDGDVIKLIRELRKLKQLRNLGVMDVKEEQGSTLCSSINEIQNLEKLNIVDDPLKSLQNMSQLLFLAIGSMSYEGKNLYFQDGGIQQLKELRLKYLYNLDSIVIYKGALHSLRKLQFREIPQLNTVPLGIQHLKKLEV
ncbi:Ubiquitin-activating enzyme E1 1 [Glycine soja]|uniref:Ubiquitin-activating enzyme E1 1 n=1 Tax=Glycine soja TaxID=3848 RepID=A0A445M269_GLYSO|nr:Ubiquitin-activating enzyme E1 1 [Glycine soja]